jgi:hypothetical protein
LKSQSTVFWNAHKIILLFFAPQDVVRLLGFIEFLLLSLPFITALHEMCPAWIGGPTLKVNKLNIYGPGGFFKSHVDAAHSANQVGTVVVCLPSPHKGGELEVRNNDSQVIIDFAEHSDLLDHVQWAVFYSDCVHEVKPVTEGIWVTSYRVLLSMIGTPNPLLPIHSHMLSHSQSNQRNSAVGFLFFLLLQKKSPDDLHPSSSQGFYENMG